MSIEQYGMAVMDSFKLKNNFEKKSKVYSWVPDGRGTQDADSFVLFKHLTREPHEIIKSERRTEIRKVNTPQGKCALKVYLYPGLSGIRTCFSISKAEREGNALAFCNALGVNALIPIAVGAHRNRLGIVCRCYLITKWETDKTSFRDWMKNDYLDSPHLQRSRLRHYFYEIGRQMAILHRHNFFLLTPFSKNIYVSIGAMNEKSITFGDLPYARTLKSSFAANWGQTKDLGAIRASALKFVDTDAFDCFFSGYGQDPFATGGATLEEKSIKGARMHMKHTPLTAALRFFRRGQWGKKSENHQ